MTESLANQLIDKIGHNQYKANQRSLKELPLASIREIQDPKLAHLIKNGVAYHHGGVPADDRALIEDLYKHHNIQVLVATSTLAFGVNLPAHLVIIKGHNYLLWYQISSYILYRDKSMERWFCRL